MDRHRRNSLLLKPLRQAPLRHRGFDERLRARILQQLEVDPSPARRRRWMPAFALMLVGFAAVLGVLFIRPSVSPEIVDVVRPAADGKVEILQVVDKPDHVWADGLLLGLRDDGHAGDGLVEDGVRYRTLWLAPEGDSLALLSDGAGILVPYGMDFWYIRNGHAGIGEGLHISKISAPTQQPGSFLLTDESWIGVPGETSGWQREKLMFAGQSFVVLEKESEGKTTHLLTSLPSLAAGERRTVSVELIAGPETPSETDWSIVREAGQWTIQTGQERYGLNRQAAVHDGLCLPWTTIAETVPGARDAFCSPSANWMAVLTADVLLALPIDEAGTLGEPALEVALAPQEQPVLAEWATGEYVDKWTAYLAILFPDGEM